MARAAFLVLALLLAGCVQSDKPKTHGDDAAAANPDWTGTTKPGTTTGGAGNTTGQPASPGAPDWPSLGQATVRPGVRTKAPDGENCTTNFLFRSRQNSSLYLGLAAHCVPGLAYGTPIEVGGATRPARLAYSSWIALEAPHCAKSGIDLEGSEVCHHDFALLEVHPDDHARTHPAILHYGGPVGLMNATQLKQGDRVLGYGNSTLRPDAEPNKWREGAVVREQGQEGLFYAFTMTPGIFGDSGSPVLTKDGKAVGAVINIVLVPGPDLPVPPGSNGIIGLQFALDTAHKYGMDVELCTWESLDSGLPA